MRHARFISLAAAVLLAPLTAPRPAAQEAHAAPAGGTVIVQHAPSAVAPIPVAPDQPVLIAPPQLVSPPAAARMVPHMAPNAGAAVTQAQPALPSTTTAQPRVTAPVAQPAQPAAQPTQPAAQPTQPVTQPTQPVTQPAATAAQPAPAPATPAASPPAAAPPAEAEPPPEAPLPPEIADAVQRLVISVENAEKSLGRMKDLGDDIGRLRNDVEHVIAETTEVADGLRPRLAEVKRQIDKLGPAPAKDAPPESASIAGERSRLTAEATALGGAIKTLELTWIRARQTIDKITDLRLAIFTKSLMERRASPLLPHMWTDVVRDLPQTSRLVGYIGLDWLKSLQRRPVAVPALIFGAALLYLALKLLARRLTRHRRPGNVDAPSFFKRAAAAAWMAPVRALPAILTGLVVYGGLDALGLLYYPSATIAWAILRSIVIFAAVAALIRSVLSPLEQRQRLFSLSDRSSSQLYRYLTAMAGVYAADLALTSIGRALYLPLSMSVLQSLIAAVAFALLLIGVLLTTFEPYGVPQPVSPARDRPRAIKYPLWGVAIAILAAAALGYVALARFAAQQVLMTGIVGMVFMLMFVAIRAFTRTSDTPNAIGNVLATRFGIEDGRRQQIAKLTEIVLTGAVGLAMLPVLLLQWGFSGPDIRDWVTAALFGFEIGTFRISLARILIGIVLFTALLFVTRLLQRWLRETVLAPPRMDSGLANSIDTVVGYVGTTVAALLAISYAGIDITNLAIVAGALSVGIGFGLQSIVNNFVSGLILLFERPVKVGDWIVVKDNEGYVRRISVRSTELETFDRASVIVPNSELITGIVRNWTHRNSLGRVVVKVRASYKSDPELVRATLLKVASTSPSILQHPEPSIVLDNLGEQALEYSLRAHVSDINQAATVQTELRGEIVKAFRDAGIGIPHANLDTSVPPVPAPPPATQAIAVKVHAAYKSDPEAVLRVLAQAAAATPGVLATPPPTVHLEALGERGLEFSVTATIPGDARASAAESAVRASIVRAMREAAIEIPHLQYDIHLRDLDTVRSLLTRIGEERARNLEEAAAAKAADVSGMRAQPGRPADHKS